MGDLVRGSRTPAAGTSLIDSHVCAVAGRLSEEVSDVVEQMSRLLAERITELDGDPALLDLLRASVAGNVDNILSSLQHGIARERLEPPSAALEYARRLAQRWRVDLPARSSDRPRWHGSGYCLGRVQSRRRGARRVGHGELAQRCQ